MRAIDQLTGIDLATAALVDAAIAASTAAMTKHQRLINGEIDTNRDFAQAAQRAAELWQAAATAARREK